LGTVSEIQHRQEITIWVEDKNKFDYYLADESFLDCFTNIDAKYKCVHNDRFAKYNRLENNIYLIPLDNIDGIAEEIEKINFNLSVFLASYNIKIVISCGHLSIDKPLPKFIVPFKVLCNTTTLNDDRIISVNSYPVKLWNTIGQNYIDERKFDVLKDLQYDIITDDKEWWDTEEMEKAAVTKITQKENVWKALMIGQPFIWNDYFELDKLGFKKYPWIDQDVDIDFVRKNSYYINKHNKENFNKIVKENNNYAIFAKKVFTF
tara:strand:+ start:2583 stop:3371 length:789 start_codon:yes stop_codon:yes gene_type:complete